MSHGAEIAFYHTRSLLADNRNAPFCFSGFQKLFYRTGAANDASFPKEGLSELSPNCPDLKGIVTSKEKEEQWVAFFNLCKRYGLQDKEKLVTDLAYDSKAKEGAKLVQAWFGRLKNRARTVEITHRVVTEKGMEVWRIHQATFGGNVDFPLVTGVCIEILII